VIVCIEGADAAGKCTQSTLLAKRLNGTRFAFPAYDTPAGQAILGHLKREWRAASYGTGIYMGHTDALVFQALQTVNRFELLPQLRAALAKGHVVYDRFTASGIVYGALDGVDPKWVELVNGSLPQPDVWIYLDIPIEESWKRRPERRDRYETDRAYLEKVRNGYRLLFATPPPHAQESPPRRGSWHILDGLGTVEEVQERIWSAVDAL
jgi:dTMP kinase